jgi:Ca-activated chloride channel family protein
MDYVFVLDVSGSMDRDGKLSMSRNSIGAFIDALGDGDRFELMSFNVTPETVFRRLEPAEQRARAEALDFLDSRRARGGTVLQPALQLAYQYKSADRPLNVVILSDGMTEPAEQSVLLQMISTRPAGTRVFCIGVGNEVNRPLLSQLAEEAGGLAAFVSRGDNFQRQAQAFRRKLLRPAASNVQIDIEGVGSAEVEPRDIPDLCHGAPLRLYGRYSSPGLARIHIRADIGGELLDEWVELDFPENDTANPEIERMWAWHRIQQLLREADHNNGRASVIDEIVRLGEAFSIVTEYTSFLVLENDGEYKRWKIERRNALRIARDRAEQQRLRTELEQLRQQSAAALGPQSGGEDDATKQASSQQSTSAAQQAPRPADANAQRQNVDVGRNRGGGGGAIDPLAALLAVLIVGAALVVNRLRV